jgi:type II secretory pathway predicted ATPase ExeA
MGFDAARSIFADAFDPRNAKTPVSNTGDCGWLFFGGHYAEVLEFLCSPVAGPANVKVVVSEPGLGKTVMLRSAVERLKGVARTAFVSWTLFNPEDFLKYLLSELGSSEPLPQDLTAAQNHFENLLRSAKTEGKRLVLAIDNAHNLSPATLGNLSALLDRDTAHPPQLTLLLAGLPALHEQIADPAASGIRERIAEVRRIAPLNAEQTAEYINARTAALGGSRLSPEQSENITARSGGVLRNIDKLCQELQLPTESWQQRIEDALRVNTPPAERSVTLVDTPEHEKSIAAVDTTADKGPITRLDSPLKEWPIAPVDVAATEEAIPTAAHVTRLVGWAADRPAMWSGTLGELASASGISVEEVSDVVENRIEELRRNGIAAAVQRSPGRPRMITLSRLQPEPTIRLQPEPTIRLQPEPTIRLQPEPTIQPDPKIEPEPTIQPNLTVQPDLMIQPDLMTETEPSVEPHAMLEPEPAIEGREKEAVLYPEASLEHPDAAPEREPASEAGLHWTQASDESNSAMAITPAVIFAIIVGVMVVVAGTILYLRASNSAHKARSTGQHVSATKRPPEADEVAGLLADRQRLASYEKAATNGDSVAQRRLGLALFSGGDGVVADRVAGYTWLVMARNGGQEVDKATLDSLTRSLTPGEIRDVRNMLGRMYERGIGCVPNPIFADEWFLLGAAANDARSREESAALERRMSRQQISQAHLLSKEWLRRHTGADHYSPIRTRPVSQSQ